MQFEMHYSENCTIDSGRAKEELTPVHTHNWIILLILKPYTVQTKL